MTLSRRLAYLMTQSRPLLIGIKWQRSNLMHSSSSSLTGSISLPSLRRSQVCFCFPDSQEKEILTPSPYWRAPSRERESGADPHAPSLSRPCRTKYTKNTPNTLVSPRLNSQIPLLPHFSPWVLWTIEYDYRIQFKSHAPHFNGMFPSRWSYSLSWTKGP